jgi:hypothetical protein
MGALGALASTYCAMVQYDMLYHWYATVGIISTLLYGIIGMTTVGIITMVLYATVSIIPRCSVRRGTVFTVGGALAIISSLLYAVWAQSPNLALLCGVGPIPLTW